MNTFDNTLNHIFLLKTLNQYATYSITCVMEYMIILVFLKNFMIYLIVLNIFRNVQLQFIVHYSDIEMKGNDRYLFSEDIRVVIYPALIAENNTIIYDLPIAFRENRY